MLALIILVAVAIAAAIGWRWPDFFGEPANDAVAAPPEDIIRERVQDDIDLYEGSDF